MMKKTVSVLAALLIALSCVVFAFAASPAVKLTCNKPAEDEILTVDVSLSGGEGTTSADLAFRYDPSAMRYLGAFLQGPAAGDEKLLASFSEPAEAEQNGRVALSFLHTEGLSAEEGEGVFCQIAFRTLKSSGVVMATADSFCVGDSETSVSLGKCRYSVGIGKMLLKNARAILIAAVGVVVLVTLVVLAIVLRRIKKVRSTVDVAPFDDGPQAPSAADGVKLSEPLEQEELSEASADAPSGEDEGAPSEEVREDEGTPSEEVPSEDTAEVQAQEPSGDAPAQETGGEERPDGEDENDEA